MRQGRRSRTSDWVAALRALYSEAPADLAVLDDALAARLLPWSLATVVRGASAVPGGARLAHRALGVVTRGLSFGIPLRTAAIDDAVHRAVEEGARQLVLLGAGLDARAWRMPRLAEVTVFELDHPDTQAYKREHAGDVPPLCREVRFCPIDFERQTIPDVLRHAGFLSEQSSIWVWEGVTMYLTLASIEATLDAIGELSAPQSRLAVTYLPRVYAEPWERTVAEVGARLIGEELRAQQDPEELASLLAARGFRVESDDTALEWAARWPAREAGRVRPFERLTVAVRE